jgi:hypothetical protein
LAIAADYRLALFRLAEGRKDHETMLSLRKTIDLTQYMPETGQWIEEALAVYKN